MKALIGIGIGIALGICAQGQDDQPPVLVLNTTMHSASVNMACASLDGRLLLSASNDRTAKIWEIASGRLLRTIRVPFVPMFDGRATNDGWIYAGALSAKGDTAALGGDLGRYLGDGNGYCYLFDTRTGRYLQKIGPFPDKIYDIRYSPAGSYLALGLGGAGAAIYNFRTKALYHLPGIDGDIYKMAFDGEGNLVTAGSDGYVRLFNKEFGLVIKKQLMPQGRVVSCLSFSSDGKKIILGEWNFIQILDAKTLGKLYVPPDYDGQDEPGIRNFAQAAFSHEGDFILAGGRISKKVEGKVNYYLRLWKDPGSINAEHRNIRAGYDYIDDGFSVTDIIPLKDNTFIYYGTEHDWGRVDTNGHILYYFPSESNEFKSEDKDQLRVNEDGSKVGFTSTYERPVTFSLNARSLSTASADAPHFRDTSPRSSIIQWRNNSSITLNGRVIPMPTYELCRSVDIPRDDSSILVGTSHELQRYDPDGRLIWSQWLPSDAYCIKASGNSRFVVAELGNGTLQWYKIADGKPLLTLCPLKDQQHWIAWTESGYYDCAIGSEKLIGWQVDQGAYREPLFYPSSKFRNAFYRPDILSRILATGNEVTALTNANSSEGIIAEKPRVKGVSIPVINILEPQNGVSIRDNVLTVKYSIDEPDSVPIDKVMAFVGDVQAYQANAVETGENSFKIKLPSRDCQISLVAVNKEGQSEPAIVALRWAGKHKDVDTLKDLSVLAIGINYSYDTALKLYYSEQDVADFCREIKRQEGLFYKKVTIKTLTGDTAKRADIEHGLRWLQKETASGGKAAMVFISGHGLTRANRFYFLPYKADKDNPTEECLSSSQIKDALDLVKGTKIVLLDACRSGSVGFESVDMTGAINTLTDDQLNTVVFASCGGNGISYENPVWGHGAFTKVLLDALQKGNMVLDHNNITTANLAGYLSTYVAQLVSDAYRKIQVPRMNKSIAIPDNYPIFKPSGLNRENK